MSSPSKEQASPACLAHEADDTYMGFASEAEITAFLAALAEAEQTGAPRAQMICDMLPRLRDDALHARLKTTLDAIIEAESVR